MHPCGLTPNSKYMTKYIISHLFRFVKCLFCELRNNFSLSLVRTSAGAFAAGFLCRLDRFFLAAAVLEHGFLLVCHGLCQFWIDLAPLFIVGIDDVLLNDRIGLERNHQTQPGSRHYRQQEQQDHGIPDIHEHQHQHVN